MEMLWRSLGCRHGVGYRAESRSPQQAPDVLCTWAERDDDPRATRKPQLVTYLLWGLVSFLFFFLFFFAYSFVLALTRLTARRWRGAAPAVVVWWAALGAQAPAPGPRRRCVPLATGHSEDCQECPNNWCAGGEDVSIGSPGAPR